MYLQEQIEMLKKRVEELERDAEKNREEVRRLEFINEQIQESQDALEEVIERLEEVEEENQENLDLFNAKNQGEIPFFWNVNVSAYIRAGAK